VKYVTKELKNCINCEFIFTPHLTECVYRDNSRFPITGRVHVDFSPFGFTATIQALAASMKLSVSLQLLI
jgi:hypothetical protein